MRTDVIAGVPRLSLKQMMDSEGSVWRTGTSWPEWSHGSRRTFPRTSPGPSGTQTTTSWKRIRQGRADVTEVQRSQVLVVFLFLRGGVLAQLPPPPNEGPREARRRHSHGQLVHNISTWYLQWLHLTPDSSRRGRAKDMLTSPVQVQPARTKLTMSSGCIREMWSQYASKLGVTAMAGAALSAMCFAVSDVCQPRIWMMAPAMLTLCGGLMIRTSSWRSKIPQCRLDRPSALPATQDVAFPESVKLSPTVYRILAASNKPLGIEHRWHVPVAKAFCIFSIFRGVGVELYKHLYQADSLRVTLEQHTGARTAICAVPYSSCHHPPLTLRLSWARSSTVS